MRLSILLFLLASTIAQAQHLVINTGMEQTANGPEVHLSSGYRTTSEWVFGGFLQSTWKKTLSESTLTPVHRDWYGIYVNAPLWRCQKINVSLQLRAGLSEQRFVVATPSVETNITVTRWMSITVASGMRYSYPSLALKTQIKPFQIFKP